MSIKKQQGRQIMYKKISSHIQKLAVISCDLNVKRILRGALYQSAKSRDHQKAISNELSAALQGSGTVRIHFQAR